MKYTINYSSRFKKSYKLCKRRGLNIANFETVVSFWPRLEHSPLSTGLIFCLANMQAFGNVTSNQTGCCSGSRMTQC